MRYLMVAALAGVLLMPMLVHAQDGPQANINTYGLKFDERTIEVLFRVADPKSGRDIQGIQPRDVKLLEDNVPLAAQIELVETQADATNPARIVGLEDSPSGAKPVEGSKPVDLGVVGATIGIVYDASQLTNVAGDSTDYVARGRDLIMAFLEAGRPIAPKNPEAIGLFLPLSVPAVGGEQIRSDNLPSFGQDRNAVINTLNQLQPRAGKTNLFDTISVAVGATADAAAQRGTEAYLLVVTDGGDSTSVGSYDALVTEATAREVKLIILGVGPQQRIATNAAALTTLAAKTEGAYEGNPDIATVQNIYQATVNVVGQSAYLLRYTTDLVDDGKPHNLIIRIEGLANGESAPIPIDPSNGGGSTIAFQLGPILQSYALRAVPLTIVLSLILTGLLVFFGRLGKGPSNSLSGGMTRR